MESEEGREDLDLPSFPPSVSSYIALGECPPQPHSPSTHLTTCLEFGGQILVTAEDPSGSEIIRLMRNQKAQRGL